MRSRPCCGDFASGISPRGRERWIAASARAQQLALEEVQSARNPIAPDVEMREGAAPTRVAARGRPSRSARQCVQAAQWTARAAVLLWTGPDNPDVHEPEAVPRMSSDLVSAREERRMSCVWRDEARRNVRALPRGA